MFDEKLNSVIQSAETLWIQVEFNWKEWLVCRAHTDDFISISCKLLKCVEFCVMCTFVWCVTLIYACFGLEYVKYTCLYLELHQCLYVCKYLDRKWLSRHAGHQEVSRCRNRCQCEESLAGRQWSTQTRNPTWL